MRCYFYQGMTNLLSKEEKNEDEILTIISDKIESLLDLKNVNFLFGSGTSAKACPLMADLYTNFKKELASDKYIDQERSLIAGIKDNGNIEDLLGVLYSLKAFVNNYKKDLENERDGKQQDTEFDVGTLINKIENYIYDQLNVLSTNASGEDITGEVKSVLELYKCFYQKVALRNKDLSRLNVFTTNNDLFNETALDALNIHYINGFTGGLTKYFNPAIFNYTMSKRYDSSVNKYEPVENMVYLYKLHGSINWIEEEKSVNRYFTIREIPAQKDKPKSPVMIYPTPIKQNKSLGAPYVDLFREFQHKLLEPNSVLFVLGYSFSDEHINDIIYRALATNSTLTLVVINRLDESKTICTIDDSRIFRIWSEEAGENFNNNIYLFRNFIQKLLPVNKIQTEESELQSFIEQYNENRKNSSRRV